MSHPLSAFPGNAARKVVPCVFVGFLGALSVTCNSDNESNPVQNVPGVQIDTTRPAAHPITDIVAFLSQCPSEDSATVQILKDFQIRRNGAIVDPIACSGSIPSLEVGDYTDELILIQGLRVIYHMDAGKSAYLPWTDKRLYDWLRSKVGGFDIRDGSGSWCCEQFGGKKFAVIGAQDDYNRDFDRQWMGIAGNIGLYIHEARHVDGFGHSSCCGLANGCDDSFDEANLSPYGMQWWLNKLWLTGEINVGMGCMSPSQLQESANWFLFACNGGFRDRFCYNKPPLVSMPTNPGGACP